MKAPDMVSFKISMGEEIENLITNDIYKLVLRSNVPETYNILRAYGTAGGKPPLMASHTDTDQESVSTGGGGRERGIRRWSLICVALNNI